VLTWGVVREPDRHVALAGQVVTPACGPSRSVESSPTSEVCRPGCRRGGRREAYVPTKQPSQGSQARVPCSDEHSWWSRRAQEPARQGPRPSVGLIGRIQGRVAFDRLHREGARYRTRTLRCTCSIDPTLTAPRVAYAISRAVGPATTRNRIRRRLRAIMRDLAPTLPRASILIAVTPATTELTFEQLRVELTALMARLPSPPSP
jgi:ribonuclease P protein component